nr:unnamed protein product [Digitaria exilis]
MAALESVLATNSESWDMDVYVVSSYLSLLAMLMDDVHQLRKSGILISSFSDAQTLDLFKCLSLHLRPGNEFFSTLDEIEWCLRNRKVSIAIRKFVSNNYKATEPSPEI